MISIVITSTSAVASYHSKTASRRLFALPLDLENGGLLSLAQRCRAAFKAQKVRGRKIHITLLENIIYKEFTHVPTTQKAVAGFASLEARTILREQASNYLINHMSFGKFKNQNGEESSLLLASPTAMLKALLTAFSSSGFKIESVHSGFDAYKAACERTILPKMGKKSFVAIDFSLEHTLVNVYTDGSLASQRRLPGYSTSMLPFLPENFGATDAEKIAKMRITAPADTLPEAVSASVVSFIWDTLRTVRVVSAPLQLEIEEFFISGDVCKSQPLRMLLKDTLEMQCTFADQTDTSPIWCRQDPAALFLSGGSLFSTLDLLSEIRVAKKNTILDVSVCVLLTLIVLAGFLAQPFAIELKTTTLDALNTRYSSLARVQAAFDKLADYSMLLNGIEMRKQALEGYKSNVSQTHPEVEQLFKASGLSLTNLSYDGLTGRYAVAFTAETKDKFLQLKDKIYANKEYYLNLSLSSTIQTDGTAYDCMLSFTPASFVPRAELQGVKVEEEPVETDIMEDFTNENK